MILRIRKNSTPNLYGRYFLASEADDETEEEVKPETATRRNIKVVTVKPSNRTKQFADVEIDGTENQDDTETTPPEETGGENDAPMTDDTTDFTADDASENTTNNNDTNDVSPETGDTGGDNTETTDDAPETGDDTNFADTGVDDDTTDATENSPETDGDAGGDDAPETGDDTNFADVAGDETGTEDDEGNTDDANGDDAANQGTADEKSKPGAEYDSTRKYNLFKEYMSLYNACDNYISKLENILKDDTVQNQIIRTSVNNLRDIKDIIYDYMTIKYPINSYIQSLLFYQKMKVSIQLIFALLKNSKNNSNTIKH